MAQPGPSPLATGCTIFLTLLFLTIGLIAVTYAVKHRHDRGATDIQRHKGMIIVGFFGTLGALAFIGVLAVNLPWSPLYITNPYTNDDVTPILLYITLGAACFLVPGTIVLRKALVNEAREILERSKLLTPSKD